MSGVAEGMRYESYGFTLGEYTHVRRRSDDFHRADYTILRVGRELCLHLYYNLPETPCLPLNSKLNSFPRPTLSSKLGTFSRARAPPSHHPLISKWRTLRTKLHIPHGPSRRRTALLGKSKLYIYAAVSDDLTYKRRCRITLLDFCRGHGRLNAGPTAVSRSRV